MSICYKKLYCVILESKSAKEFLVSSRDLILQMVGDKNLLAMFVHLGAKFLKLRK